jgi:hypothetical protein
MAAMDAVKVADGQRNGAMAVGWVRESTKYLHCDSCPRPEDLEKP